jgi:AcrR family transcriptional regulator
MLPRERFQNLENDKKQRILDTAVEEFAAEGFRGASINRMVQRLGIAKGSIFQYFGSKEGLFHLVFQHAVELVRRSLRRVREDSAEADFFEKIHRSLQAGVRFIDHHPKVYQIYLKMVFQEDFPLRAEFLNQVHLFSAEYLKPFVESGIARGELREDLNVDTAVFFLDAIMDRFLQAYSVSFLDARSGIYRAGPEEISRRMDEFIRLIRHGMGVGDGPR